MAGHREKVWEVTINLKKQPRSNSKKEILNALNDKAKAMELIWKIDNEWVKNILISYVDWPDFSLEGLKKEIEQYNIYTTYFAERTPNFNDYISQHKLLPSEAKEFIRKESIRLEKEYQNVHELFNGCYYADNEYERIMEYAESLEKFSKGPNYRKEFYIIKDWKIDMPRRYTFAWYDNKKDVCICCKVPIFVWEWNEYLEIDKNTRVICKMYTYWY